MALWKRSKKDEKRADGASPSGAVADSQTGAASGVSGSSAGIVSSVLSGPTDVSEQTPFGDIVARRFGPGKSQQDTGSRLPPQHPTAAIDSGEPAAAGADDSSKQASTPGTASGNTLPGRMPGRASGGQGDARDSQQTGPEARDRLRAVAPLFSDQPATPELEVDLMAHIGRETTITGDIVAEEDLEIQGTIEGSVRLSNHQVTVGNEGHVKASVDAHTVIVFGKITGDVVASELVEVEKGGIVGGDIKSPRVIMHDGAIVVGGLDMSASLPNPAEESRPIARTDGKSDAKLDGTLDGKDGAQSARPKLEWVESEQKTDAADSLDGSTS